MNATERAAAASWTERGAAASSTERGAAATELAVLVPAVLLVLAALVGGARVWFASAAVVDAAHAAARAATLARDASTARQDAQSVFEENLRTAGLRCSDNSLGLDLAGFSAPVGVPANVTARARCRVALDDLIGFGLPGAIEVNSRAVSALDTYRRR